MEEVRDTPSKHDTEQDLYLIELPGKDGPKYLVCERAITVDPGQSVMGVPWDQLARLFEGHTLRAVPMPGTIATSSLSRTTGGVSTRPGVSTVEVNLIKIERKD